MAHNPQQWQEQERFLQKEIETLELERRTTFSLYHVTKRKSLQSLLHFQEEEIQQKHKERHLLQEKIAGHTKKQRAYRPIRFLSGLALGIALLLLFSGIIQFTGQYLGSVTETSYDSPFIKDNLPDKGFFSVMRSNSTNDQRKLQDALTGAVVGVQEITPFANSYYDPTGDSGAQEWTLNCGDCAGSHYLAVDDAVRQPTAPTITDNVSVGSIAGTRLDNWSVSSITESSINGITLYAYVRTGSKNQLSIKLTQSGTTQCTISVGTSQAIGWQSCAWSSPTGDLSGVTIGAIHTSTNQDPPATTGFIFATYLDVDYTTATPKPQDTNMSCGTLNWNTTLNVTSVTNTSTCYTVNASNIDLNCAGATVTYGTGGSGLGVDNTAGYSGVTIRNCNFVEGGSIGSSKYGIYYTGSSSGTIRNNTISTFSSSSIGARLESSSGSNLIVSNVINTTGSSAHGIMLLSSNSNTLDNNNISTNGSGAHGISFA
ncbi:MAG: right-handed parallel beta-helix repeat-containing protein, partial [Nanoarchaeota archaeon]